MLQPQTEITNGRCYWYTPRPTSADLRCDWCGFIFGKDHEREYRDGRMLVLVLHPARKLASQCPACQTSSTMERGDWFRVTNLRGLTSDAVVHRKWLTLTTPEEVEEETVASENRADRLLGHRAADILDFDDDDDDDLGDDDEKQGELSDAQETQE